MDYKQTLYFIAKSLTISLEDKNSKEIKKQLQSGLVDWESVVKLSTAHYVFTALYCNLKRVDFLKHLPVDLADYMKYITDLNTERNREIIIQANKLNRLFLDNLVKPIFLKGTGNLLENLYENIGERMVGDIDILFCEKDYSKAIDILKKDGYRIEENQIGHFQGYRHYSRLVKKDNIAAVEIHKEVTTEKYRDEFNSKTIIKDIQIINDCSLLSFENQLSLSIISSQINDQGFILKKLPLRNAYDVFLLSKKVNTKKIISGYINLKNPLNCFLASCNFLFGDLETLEYLKTKQSENYLKKFIESYGKRGLNLKNNFKLKIINFKRRFIIFYKSIFNREDRKWLLNRIKSEFRGK